mmetsp:Transcript_36199/g.104290  ORF Transcript_36199/g.104290 Transcript_36199/m.104290 type:complete len:94 (-) Transcript_36199:598-879(-)
MKTWNECECLSDARFIHFGPTPPWGIAVRAGAAPRGAPCAADEDREGPANMEPMWIGGDCVLWRTPPPPGLGVGPPDLADAHTVALAGATYHF